MKFLMLHSKKIMIVFLSSVLLLICLSSLYAHRTNTIKTVMGGTLSQHFTEAAQLTGATKHADIERYFRPSNLPVLNDRTFPNNPFHNFYDKGPSEFILPDHLLKTPEDTLLNYFSIIREAANPKENTTTGCGTLGEAKSPYPLAYNFLSSDYQQKLSFNDYLKSFENILHINLIKLRKVPTDENHPNTTKYFVEIETIKGSENYMGYFGYYYGYAYITKEGDQYRLSDIEFIGQNYLCAPYHGWDYIAEFVVDIKYGEWCSLVKKRYPTQQDGYVKRIYFEGTDGNNYLFIFFELTNGTDIEIAQYKQNILGEWELIKLDPTKCLDKNH